MKYTYVYKTSDGIRHEDSMVASSREEVFAALRAKGIKAIKVVAEDGSKANGAPPPRGWATAWGQTLLAAAAAALIGGVAWWLWAERRVGDNAPYQDAQEFLTSQARRQVIGDVAIVEKGIRTGWSGVFEREGDRFLASFAIPGVPAGQRSTSEEEMRRALEGKVAPQPTDSMEVRQIKAMVEGMKEEARRYIAAGGSPVDYGKRLVERQEAEIAIYNRVKGEIEKIRDTMAPAAFETYLEERNDELRNLGIKPIVDNRD